jgi:hypothetical protein
VIQCSICKANNEDRSLYCLECGQRLIPVSTDNTVTSDIAPTSTGQKPNFSASSRLRSPILDLGKGADTNDSHSNSISRNGLHSPLLDGQNYFTNPHPQNEPEDIKSDNFQSNSPIRESDKSRLHSPVLDGPFSASFKTTYIEESYTEEEEYESLRSPLLKARVPLPEKKEPVDTSQPQTALGSILKPTTGPVMQPSQPVSSDKTNKENNFIAPLSITGINKLSKRASQNISKPPGLIFGSDPSDEEGILPKSNIQTNRSINPINKTLITSLVFLAIGFKIWYLLSLGNTAFASAPFAFDQIGQIIVLILILILALT